MRSEFPPPAEEGRPTDHPDAAGEDGAGAIDAHGPTSQDSSQGSHTDKENAPPVGPSPGPGASSSTHADASGGRQQSDNANSVGAGQPQLPPSHADVFKSIRTTLTTSFQTAPPHTIQRLAELILRPRAHYRFLGPYLRGLDRVVSVSSGTDVFPPVEDRPESHAGNSILPNGTSSGNSWSAMVDGDEILGGALLTPIEWLQHEEQDEMQLDGSHDDGVNGIDTSGAGHGMHGMQQQQHHQLDPNESLREGGAVTQEELLRQEQEAGTAPTAEPVGRHPRSPTAARSSEDGNTMEMEDQHPHTSGPEEVGLEDTGPQDPGDMRGRFDVDVALGRKTPHGEEKAMEENSGESTAGSEQETPPSSATADDVMVTDADGQPTDDAGIE